jgi:Tfp pilus assembly protein PilW
MKKILGFSLVEMLVAGAILSILLLVLTNLFVSSNKASKRVDELSDQQQQAQAARQILQYELNLAGYKGTDTGFASRTFGSDNKSIKITKSSSGSVPDTLEVRYYENRTYTANNSTTLRSVVFSIASDNGTLSLFRKQDNSAAIPIIPDVSNLKISEYILNDNTKAVTASNNLAGLKLNLTYANQQQDTILIVFQNAQTVSVTN